MVAITRITIMDDLVFRALLGGIGLAVIAAPFGAFLVWRRMAYFGAALAHAAILGIALGFLFEINITLAILVVSGLSALILVALERQRTLSSDTILGILAHGALALGLIVIALQDRLRVDLMAYLFGDILALGPSDILLIYGGGGAALAVLFAIWRPLLSLTIHADLARVEGVGVEGIRLVFMLLLALVVGLAMKIVGLLLVTSLFIIPAACARRFAATPEAMAAIAALIGAVAVVLGLWVSFYWDLPSGPAIVMAAIIFFIVSMPFSRRIA